MNNFIYEIVTHIKEENDSVIYHLRINYYDYPIEVDNTIAIFNNKSECLNALSELIPKIKARWLNGSGRARTIAREEPSIYILAIPINTTLIQEFNFFPKLEEDDRYGIGAMGYQLNHPKNYLKSNWWKYMIFHRKFV